MRASRRTALATLSLLGAAALAACGSSPASAPASPAASAQASTSGASGVSGVSGQVTVLAAASLQDAFEELKTDFEEASPDATVTFDFQGSQDLVTALAEGAGGDVLATANTSTMKDATSKNLVGQSTEFATNVLTLIVPAGNPAHVTGLDSSLAGADLVVCAAAVPCGEATAKVAAELGVTLSPVSEEQKVTDVRGKVESGEADAGIVYTTDAADAGDKVEAIALPSNSVVNHYPIAVTTGATNTQAAQAFVDLVLSEAGQKVLSSYGFGAPAAK